MSDLVLVGVAFDDRDGDPIEPIETAPASVTSGLPVPPGCSVVRRVRAERSLESAAALLPADVGGEAKLVTGHAAIALAEPSVELDLLVCGSRGHGPLRAVLLGGVSSAIAHTAACPLLVIPRGDATRLGEESATAAARDA